MSEAGVIRGRKERRQRRHHRNRRKTKIALAVLRGFFQFFHYARRRAYGVPANTVLTGHPDASIQFFRVTQNRAEEILLRFAVSGVQERRTDRRREILLHGQRVVILEKRDGLFFRQAFGVFRKRLRRDADGLHLVAARFECRLRAPQHFQRVRHVLLVSWPVQIDEGSDRADLGIPGRCRSFRLGPNNFAVENQGQQRRNGETAEKSNRNDEFWTHGT